MSENPQLYINRELSWLEFNQRVLDQARNDKLPLLERLKFLAITAGNLDEFFMVRVGGLQLQVEDRVQTPDPVGLTASQQLEAIFERAGRMVDQQYQTLIEKLDPALREAGIERVRLRDATARQWQAVERLFEEEIFPVLSPMIVAADGPFPLLPNLGLCMAVRLIDPQARSEAPRLDSHVAGGSAAEAADPSQEPDESGGQERFALIPLGRAIARLLSLPADSGYRYVLLEELVANQVERFFPGTLIQECVAFRITRNCDISIREDSAADLMRGMTRVLLQRRTADCVRLEIAAHASDALVETLRERLDLDRRDVFRIRGPLNLSDLMPLALLEGFPQLRDPDWPPQDSPQIDAGRSLFDTIQQGDVLLCHPYERFDPVVRFLEEAADDPDVLAIKQVLYRTSRTSAIVSALKRAAERGKYVTVILELKARFDEARNIEWARELEQAQVQVIYGVRGLKTHAKICIVVRREPQGVQRYVHFGTGNYNESTARLYSDISYMTAREEWGADASAFFNAVTGYSQPQPYRRIEAAPIGLRKRLITLIEHETQRKRQGQRAFITAKLNALVDTELIGALYRASQAGVPIRLNIRGVCCLRPGVPGLSEKIQVISVVDRYLEHARILHFHHGGDEQVFLSSADWMPRNLDRRVELLVPVEDPTCRRRLIQILDTYFRDNQNAWRLLEDGSYRRLKPSGKAPPFRAQVSLYEDALAATEQAERTKRTIFEPHQAADPSR
jgi:polyphosphate kinase